MMIVYVMTAITGLVGALIAIDDLKFAKRDTEENKA